MPPRSPAMPCPMTGDARPPDCRAALPEGVHAEALARRATFARTFDADSGPIRRADCADCRRPCAPDRAQSS
jgi:hypothetical protein